MHSNIDLNMNSNIELIAQRQSSLVYKFKPPRIDTTAV